MNLWFGHMFVIIQFLVPSHYHNNIHYGVHKIQKSIYFWQAIGCCFCFMLRWVLTGWYKWGSGNKRKIIFQVVFVFISMQDYLLVDVLYNFVFKLNERLNIERKIFNTTAISIMLSLSYHVRRERNCSVIRQNEYVVECRYNCHNEYSEHCIF